MNPSARILVLFLVFLALVGGAVVLPQLTASGSEGLAAGATAAVTFLGFMFLALILAIVMLVMTLRHRAGLNGSARVAGFLPLPILLVGAVVMVVMIRAKVRAAPQDQSSPPTTTAPATTAP